MMRAFTYPESISLMQLVSEVVNLPMLPLKMQLDFHEIQFNAI